MFGQGPWASRSRELPTGCIDYGRSQQSVRNKCGTVESQCRLPHAYDFVLSRLLGVWAAALGLDPGWCLERTCGRCQWTVSVRHPGLGRDYGTGVGTGAGHSRYLPYCQWQSTTGCTCRCDAGLPQLGSAVRVSGRWDPCRSALPPHYTIHHRHPPPDVHAAAVLAVAPHTTEHKVHLK